MQGTLYIISAPSGGGKTSIVRALMEKVSGLVISVSYTTRPPRPVEQNDINYHFVSDEKFQQLLKDSIFLEHAKVFGHCYGTSKHWVEEQLTKGLDVILEIDWQGAEQIRKQFSKSVSVFILPPSLEILRKRLCERAQDAELVIEQRMQQAKAEMSHYAEFDYLIINDDFDTAVNDLLTIVKSQRLLCVKQEKVHQAILENLL